MDGFPSGYGFLSDQLRRAAVSVLLNFSEGAGKSTPRERKRYFSIAKGSAYEVAAALDAAKCFEVMDPSVHHHAVDLCDQIAAMLSRYR